MGVVCPYPLDPIICTLCSFKAAKACQIGYSIADVTLAPGTSACEISRHLLVGSLLLLSTCASLVWDAQTSLLIPHAYSGGELLV